MKEVISKEKTKELIARAYNTAKAHGFHDTELSLEHMFMLVISEVSEAVEADRKDRHADINGFIERENVHPNYSDRFNEYIKGSVEEELADVCIRMFDIYGVLNRVPDLHRHDGVVKWWNENMYKKSFCEKCYYITTCFYSVCPQEQSYVSLDIALSEILCLCKELRIDIMQHIEWKMQYNESRPPKHGKNY